MGKARRNDEERYSRPKTSYASLNASSQVQNLATDDSEKQISFKALMVCAICCGLLNTCHVSTMFENYRHFSHLSNLEREMTFRSEMGFYYSFYKTLIESESFIMGLHRILDSNLTEYPDTINALQRFNIYPEVVLGGSYRVFASLLHSLGIDLPRMCWQVMRGDNMPPVVSCEGLGDPIYWYLNGVWLAAGATGALVFIHGAQLSGCLLGGFVSILCFFFNHGEASRVQWTPPLRESFAFPWSLAMNIVVTHALRNCKLSWVHPLLYGNLALNYLLCWQFAQFIIVINIAILYIMYALCIINGLPMLLILTGGIYALLNSMVLQFGSPFLLASPLASVLLGVLLLYVFLEPLIQQFPAPTVMGMKFGFFVISSLACRIELSRIFGMEDDEHIISLLKSKFSNYSDFHTLMYTCSPEYDFLPMETMRKLSETLLIPVVALVGGCCLINIINTVKENFIKRLGEKVDLKTPLWSGVDVAIIYNFLLLAVYGLLAILVMRLKLFLTPQLCVMASLLAARKYWKRIQKNEIHFAFLMLILSAMLVSGVNNIKEQRSVVGEYSNPNLEELINWVQTETPSNAVFAGPMPTMANLHLSTKRPIVNHPHYENAILRERTKKVYSLCSRHSAEEVYETMLSMKVNFVVLEEGWCLRKSRPGCGMVEIWDVDEPHNKHRPPLCPKLFYRNPAPFHKVFSNEEYVILQVPSKYVEIPPPRSQSS